MPHSYISAYYHIVFRTGDSTILLPDDVRKRLYPFIGGIIRREIGTPIAINGTADHVHVLFETGSTLSLAMMAQYIKGASSKWLNDTFLWSPRFEWQVGYGGFTVSLRAVPTVKQYILNQEEHHRKYSWEDEWARLCDRHDAFRASNTNASQAHASPTHASHTHA
jgi:REP element-mobilizing transposase RayT